MNLKMPPRVKLRMVEVIVMILISCCIYQRMGVFTVPELPNSPVYFINKTYNVKNILPVFKSIFDGADIPVSEPCIIAKKRMEYAEFL